MISVKWRLQSINERRLCLCTMLAIHVLCDHQDYTQRSFVQRTIAFALLVKQKPTGNGITHVRLRLDQKGFIFVYGRSNDNTLLLRVMMICNVEDGLFGWVVVVISSNDRANATNAIEQIPKFKIEFQRFILINEYLFYNKTKTLKTTWWNLYLKLNTKLKGTLFLKLFLQCAKWNLKAE